MKGGSETSLSWGKYFSEEKGSLKHIGSGNYGGTRCDERCGNVPQKVAQWADLTFKDYATKFGLGK